MSLLKRARWPTNLLAPTAESRSAGRYRKAGLTAISIGAARSVAILGALVIVPFALDYLGPERYGVWLTISSFVGLLAFSDLGLGNGLLTAISRSQGRNDEPAIKSYVASGFFLLSGAAVALASAFMAMWLFVDWARVFNLTSEADASEADAAMVAFAVLFVGAIPLCITEKVQWALQEGYKAGVWQAIGAAIGIFGILATIWLGGDLRYFSLALLGGPLIAAGANWVVTFGHRHRNMRPRWSLVSARPVRELLRLGGTFFGLQIAVAVAFASDNLVVAQLLGPEHVPQLAVPFQMFAVLSVIVGLMLTPLWPAYGESIGRGDFGWVRKALRRSMRGSLAITAVGSALLLFVGPWLIEVWAGPEIKPQASLLWALAFLTVLTAVGNSIAMFLNGAGKLRIQLIAGALMATTALVTKIVLVPRYGVAAVVWATVASYSVLIVVPLSAYARHLLAQLEDKSPAEGSDPIG